MNKLSTLDRTCLLRLASALPKGSEERKVILSGLSKLSSKEEVEVGDVVTLRTRRGSVKATVVERQLNYRSRKFPAKFRFTTDSGQDFKFESTSFLYSDPTNSGVFTFVSSGGSSKAIEDSLSRRENIEQKKQDRVDANFDILKDLRLDKGDVILYKYTNATTSEVVAGVNYQTGKVGVERFSPSQKEEYLRQVKETKDAIEFYSLIHPELSYGRRGPNDRSVRWLPASGILKVLKRISG